MSRPKYPVPCAISSAWPPEIPGDFVLPSHTDSCCPRTEAGILSHQMAHIPLDSHGVVPRTGLVSRVHLVHEPDEELVRSHGVFPALPNALRGSSLSIPPLLPPPNFRIHIASTLTSATAHADQRLVRENLGKAVRNGEKAALSASRLGLPSELYGDEMPRSPLFSPRNLGTNFGVRGPLWRMTVGRQRSAGSACGSYAV